MAPTKSSRKRVVKTERSWLYRHFGTVVFSTLIFSTVAYAITWPTVPGEAGYPVEWSFWKIFEKILVDTGATNDGTVKKSESLGKKIGRTAIVTDTNGNIGVGWMTASGDYTLSVSGQALFTDTVLGTPPTSSWHLATKGYVDGVVSAWGGGGGYNQCYRIRNMVPSYPTCATWFSRVYSAYWQKTDWWGTNPDTFTVNFENNVWWTWFNNYWHVYLYYTYVTDTFDLYDDQDVRISDANTLYISNSTSFNSVFSSKRSTFQSYTTTWPANFTYTWWNTWPNDFGYAVCCK